MNIPKQAVLVLAAAEQQLRDLVATEATAGHYDAIQQITDWARILGTMVREAEQSGLTQAFTGAVSDATASPREDLPNSNHYVGQQPSSYPAEGATRRVPRKGQYPLFFKQGDQLLKIGWSRTTKKEYEHKVPRRIVDALTAAITRRSKKNKLFTVDDLLPLKDLQDNTDIPTYQIYVALAWLRLGGLVKQHGRRGYSVKNSSHLGEAAIASWRQLEENSI